MRVELETLTGIKAFQERRFPLRFQCSFLLVDISARVGENLYANFSRLCNQKFDLISQSGCITLTSA